MMKVDANDIRELSDYHMYIDDCNDDTAPDRMFEYGELVLIKELIDKNILVADKEYIEILDDLISKYITELTELGCL